MDTLAHSVPLVDFTNDDGVIAVDTNSPAYKAMVAASLKQIRTAETEAAKAEAAAKAQNDAINIANGYSIVPPPVSSSKTVYVHGGTYSTVDHVQENNDPDQGHISMVFSTHSDARPLTPRMSGPSGSWDDIATTDVVSIAVDAAAGADEDEEKITSL